MADPPPEPRTFLIADDHPMVRDALASALGQAFAGAGIAMAASLPQAQAALERAPETDELGASAYIDKSASLEEIAGTVRAVLDGEIFAPPDTGSTDSFAQRAAQLTPQQ